MYEIALNIFVFGWGDAGDDDEFNRRKRTYLGLDEDEQDVLKAPVLSLLKSIVSISIKNKIDINLYKRHIYEEFYKTEIYDEYLEEDTLKEIIPAMSKDIFKENPYLSERIALMDKFIELSVHEQTGMSIFEYMNLRETDRFYLDRILNRVHESKATAIDDILKEEK